MISRKRLTRSNLGVGAKHAVILFVLALELFPLYMMLQISVKDNRSFVANPWLPDWVGSWQWANYAEAFVTLLPSLANSVFVSVLAVGVSMVCAVSGAYFFARFKLPGQSVLFALFIFLLVMPSVANIVPLFGLLRNLSLLNTLYSLSLVGAAAATAFNILVLKTFIEELPYGLFEAAEIDGASHLRQIWHVVVPLCGSPLATLSILLFIREWNEYILAIIVLRDEELYTVGLKLIYLDGEVVKNWGVQMAAFVLAGTPLALLFFATLKFYIKGLIDGAIKG